VYNDIEKRSIFIIWSKTDVLNAATFKYFLHKFNEMVRVFNAPCI